MLKRLVLVLLLAGTSDYLGRIASSLASADARAFERLARSLESSSALVGASSFSVLHRIIEEAAKAGRLSDRESPVATPPSSWPAVEAALSEEISRLARGTGPA